MLKKVFQNITRPNTVAGIEVLIKDAGKYEYNVVVLKKNKNQVQLLQSEQKVNDLEKVKETIKNIPVCLAISGRGILHKKVKNIPDNLSIHLQQVLPNAKPEAFFMQVQDFETKQSYTSVIRKDTIEAIIQQFSEKGMDVIDVGLGPFCLESIIPLLPLKVKHRPHLELGMYKLGIEEDQITEFTQNSGEKRAIEERIKIGEENIPANLMVSFATAFSGLFSFKETFKNFDPAATIKEEWEQKSIFKVAGWSVLIFFLSILLANYLVFDYLTQQNNALASELNRNQGLLKKVTELREQIEEKEQFLKATGLSKPSQTSWYADQLAGTVPENIQLTGLTVHPVKEDVDPREKRVIFLIDEIEVRGVCKNSYHLNEWLKRLRTLAWIGSVEIDNYVKDPNDDLGHFDLKVVIG